MAAGTAFAIPHLVLLRTSANGFLIVAAMLVSAAKLQSEDALTPMAVTAEVNRCLTCVRVAASRRGSDAPLSRQLRRHCDVGDRRPGFIVAPGHSAPARG